MKPIPYQITFIAIYTMEIKISRKTLETNSEFLIELLKILEKKTDLAVGLPKAGEPLCHYLQEHPLEEIFKSIPDNFVSFIGEHVIFTLQEAKAELYIIVQAIAFCLECSLEDLNENRRL